MNRCIKEFLNKRHIPKVVELTAAGKELVYCHSLDSSYLKFEIEFSVALRKTLLFAT